MKKLFTLMFLLVATMMLPQMTTAQTTYTVAGSYQILNGNASWDPTNTANDMMLVGESYQLTVSGISVEAGNYEVRVVTDHSWATQYPSGSAKSVSISETAKYDIVYVLDLANETVNVTPTKVGEYEGQVAEHTYTVAGDAALFGSDWSANDANNLMVKGDDGKYTLVLKDKELTAATTCKFKIVQDNAWDVAYPTDNAWLYIEETGKYDVTITFDATTKEWTAVAVVSTPVTFDFAGETIRENIGEAMADVKGFIYNDTFTAENVKLQITCGSAPSRIYKDASRGQNLVTYKEYTTLTFKAPKGFAITKIEFTAAGNSNIKNFTASSGAIEGMVWTGNAEGVRFAQGGTSYLANAIVTLAAKTAETATLPAIEYTECANIAAFNALAAGTYAKVKLTDAEVIGKSADDYSTVFIQDATGGCWIQYTSLNAKLAEKNKLNGFVYVVARPNSGNVQMKETEDTPKSELTIGQVDELTIVEGTLAQVNVAANLNKVVKITGATLEETSASAGKLTQGETTIDVNNGTATANQQLHKIADWAKDTKLENITIVAILVGKSTTANQLLPISITSTATGIQNVNSNINATDVQIYNLQGVRMNKVQRGLNIVNGKKFFVK
jgi:hypothetical protein